MDERGRPTYTYLNRDNRWLDFHDWNLERQADGSLRLASVPLLSGVIPPEIAQLSLPDGVAGTTLADGSLYYTDPHVHRIWRVEPCFHQNQPVHCFSGPGSSPGQCNLPRGLAWHPLRNLLAVADSGNHRVQLLDVESMQVADIWGQLDPSGHPQPGSAPGQLDTPTSLAIDPDANLFVVDGGNSRLQQFDADGIVVPSFWQNVQKSAPHLVPAEVAVGQAKDVVEVFVLDVAAGQLWVFDQTGNALRSSTDPAFRNAMGLVVLNDEVYLGDNSARRVLRFLADLAFVGSARGFAGPVAALCGDDSSLYVHTGGALPPLRLERKKAYAARGLLWGGPFPNLSPRLAPSRTDGRPERLVMLHRLRCFFEKLAGDAHVQLYGFASASAAASPPDPLAGPGRVFDSAQWRALGRLDTLEGMFPGSPKDFIWIGMEFTGGLQSPVLPNARLDFDHHSLLEHVPGIYKEKKVQSPLITDDPGEDSRWFLLRFLSLFESPFEDVARLISKLNWIFDPWAVPAKYLPWLADTVGVELYEAWSESKKRQAIAKGFAMHARRGTPAGLSAYVKFVTGIDIQLSEPIVHAAWWALPGSPDASRPDNQNSILGVTTMLAATEPQEAVVGISAVLDHSHLNGGEGYAAALFSDLAHRFLVQVHRAQVNCPERLDALRSVIEQQKPAHTGYHLCVVEPRMRLGFQSRLGVDTIVASGLVSASNLQGAASGLAGSPPGSIGTAARVGRDTRLGVGATL